MLAGDIPRPLRKTKARNGIFAINLSYDRLPNTKGLQNINNRERKNQINIYLSDDELFLLNQKVKRSEMSDKSSFIRHLILYGYVYDVDYSYLREYNILLGRITSSLNQIAKRVNSTNNIYKDDIKEIREDINQISILP